MCPRSQKDRSHNVAKRLRNFPVRNRLGGEVWLNQPFIDTSTDKEGLQLPKVAL